MNLRSNFIHLITFIAILSIGLGSCSFSQKVKNGQMAYDAKQYAVAIDMLEKEYNNSKDDREKARKAYLIGKSYHLLEENDYAINWFKKAIVDDADPSNYLALAKSYKKSGDYNAAIAIYEQLKQKVKVTTQIEREIFVLKDLARWKPDDTQVYEVKLMNENSGFSEYAPVIYDDNFLVFTSDTEMSTGNDTYKWTGNKYSDLFVMLKTGSNKKRFDALINSKHNDGAACFTKDYEEIVFTRCFIDGEFEGDCKLMRAQKLSGIWTEPEILPFVIPGINYGQPTFIENDSVMVFSSEMEGGIGGHDLYYVERMVDDQGEIYWTEPAIMPQTVNSQGDELFPTGRGDTLYYSSDYLPGLGGLDIFMTYLTDDGQWAPPTNLKQPINSSFDDFSFVVDKNAPLRGSELEKGFFTSTRKGYGKEDIYQYTLTGVKKEIIDESEDDDEPEIEVEIYLAGTVKRYKYEDPTNPNSPKIGKEVLPSSKVTINDGNGEIDLEMDENGRFITQLTKNTNYTIKASKSGYLNDKETVSTYNLKVPEGNLSTTINIELLLPKIFEGVEITLENIYYNFNKWDIRDDAKPALDSLTEILTENPQINIQLSSHTDCRGDDDYNQTLSQKRAQSAIQYIASKGISINRLTAKGYGESFPSVVCSCDDCTEEEHQQNRRTTFKIVK